MQLLKGKTILVGREPEKGRLLLSVKINGQNKILAMGTPHCVPNTVTRCLPNEDKAHCKIEVIDDNNVKITNLKESNCTMVDGCSVDFIVTNKNKVIMLGADNFQVNVGNILNALKKIIDGGGGGDVVISVRHLEKVWNDYASSLEKIQRQQMERGKKRLIPPIITSVSSVLTTILTIVIGTKTLFLTLPLTILTIIYWMKIYNEKDTSIEDRKKAEDVLIDNYICPRCNSYIGLQKYKVLRKNYTTCPHCKAKWNF